MDGRPRPRILWFFRNQPINHTRVLSNGSLLLSSVKNNDLYEGRYSCFAENSAGQSRMSIGYLTVDGKFSAQLCPATQTSAFRTIYHKLKRFIHLSMTKLDLCKQTRFGQRLYSLEEIYLFGLSCTLKSLEESPRSTNVN